MAPEPGDRFVEKPYDDLKNLYLNYLPNHGYPKVKVKGRVYLDEAANTAKILLTVNPGPLCYFGPVRIKDAEKLETPEAAVLSKLTFKAGQLFNQEKLFDTQRKTLCHRSFQECGPDAGAGSPPGPHHSYSR